MLTAVWVGVFVVPCLYFLVSVPVLMGKCLPARGKKRRAAQGLLCGLIVVVGLGSLQLYSLLRIDLGCFDPWRTELPHGLQVVGGDACLYEESAVAEGFTLVCNTYKRNERLFKSVRHYLQCPLIREYRVVWSDTETPPPYEVLQSYATSRTPITVDRHETNSFNNRFKPLPNLGTEAVLSIDDDILLSCDDLAYAFRLWRQNPHRMVGFFARAVDCNPDGSYHYQGILHQRANEYLGYSIVLTKAAFHRADYLAEYSNLPSTVTDTVDEFYNCEDIAFSFMVAAKTHEPPIWVQAQFEDSGRNTGVGSGSHHHETRDICLNRFATAMGMTAESFPPANGIAFSRSKC